MPSKSTHKVPEDFYLGQDVLLLARQLLGMHLVTRMGGQATAGRIVEVEAYAGATDNASHAYGNRRTARTEVMFARGGVAYVYLCYGIHHLFNVVTHEAGTPHAILVRAVEPTMGIGIMQQRRGMALATPRLTAGPGALSQALGITTLHTGQSLQGPSIWIEDHGEQVQDSQILASPRVGVAYAGADAMLPYRFRIRDCIWTSPAEPRY